MTLRSQVYTSASGTFRMRVASRRYARRSYKTGRMSCQPPTICALVPEFVGNIFAPVAIDSPRLMRTPMSVAQNHDKV